ncbi:MAG: disulfide bond formation protein B [Parachlamydiales bacterium]|nr:disulfide bond formation protein B [Parachlamydiales bacterium]
MEKFLRFANALFILVFVGMLASGYYEQIFHHEQPCPLCRLQRLAMFGISLGLFLNLRNGINHKHYGFSLFFALFGGTVSLRQMALHACPGFPVFGIPVWGLSLYTWAFLAFAISILAIAILLILHPKEMPSSSMNWFEWLAAICILILLCANAATSFYYCGYGPCQDVPWPQPPSVP